MDRSSLLPTLIAIAVLALGGWRLFLLLRSQSRLRKTKGPKGLFQELCQAHDLDRSARHALWTLSKHLRLEHPSRVFLEPACFDLIEDSREIAALRTQLAALRTRLFEE